MANYRRLISYIYAYEGGIKGKNVGYAKIEVRGGQSKVTVNVKKVYVGSSDIGVYLLNGEREILLGKIFIRNGGGEYRATFPAQNVDGSGVTMDQCFGLTIHDMESTWQAYTTIWEDAVAHAAEIELANVTSENRIKQEDQRKKDEEKQIKTSQLIEPAPQTIQSGSFGDGHRQSGSYNGDHDRDDDRRNHDRDNYDSDDYDRDDYDRDNHHRDHQPDSHYNNQYPGMPFPEEPFAEGLAAEEVEAEQSSVPEPVTLPEPENPDLLAELERQEQEGFNQQDIWNQFQCSQPKLNVFDYENGCEILSIKPQDLGLLPREIWVYGNNSFLLHGYYNHRHLILARLNNPNGRPRFLLGVPGHYYSNERYMASMFGFSRFVLAKNQKENEGRFGYWYTDVQI